MRRGNREREIVRDGELMKGAEKKGEEGKG